MLGVAKPVSLRGKLMITNLQVVRAQNLFSAVKSSRDIYDQKLRAQNVALELSPSM